jgi:hypothetical protein
MKPAGYFVLGFVVASALWLIGLTVLHDQLLGVFSSFAGH